MIKTAKTLRSALAKCGKHAAKGSDAEPLTYRCDCRHILSGKDGQIADMTCGITVTLTLVKLTAAAFIIAFYVCVIAKKILRFKKK